MSVRLRTLKDGSPYWQVRFREHNREKSLSWDNPADAQRCDDLIKKVGPARAREILQIIDTPRAQLTLTDWLTKHVDYLTGVEDGTRVRYRAYIRNDITPAIGDIPLVNLSRDDVARWLANLGGSGKTQKNKRDFLSGALKAAVKAGHITTNPCEDVRTGRWDRQEMVFLDRDEYALVRDALTELWRPLVEFLVTSGCRWSEATALRPGDVDHTAGTVRINRA